MSRGVPFEDTNTPSHHTWVFFPSRWIGGAVFDRGAGSAATVGPTNFGGSIGLLSRDTEPDPAFRLTTAYGSWNTSLLDLSMDSGDFGPGASLTVDVHQMRSSGFETGNTQMRDAGSLKYQFRLSDRTTTTVWGGVVDLWANTPNVGPTRAQIAQYGYDFLNCGDPTQACFFAYNYYPVQSDFSYAEIRTEPGKGWHFDDKSHFYRYRNKQNYDTSVPLSATSAVDKLNGYSKAGDFMTFHRETAMESSGPARGTSGPVRIVIRFPRIRPRARTWRRRTSTSTSSRNRFSPSWSTTGKLRRA